METKQIKEQLAAAFKNFTLGRDDERLMGTKRELKASLQKIFEEELKEKRTYAPTTDLFTYLFGLKKLGEYKGKVSVGILSQAVDDDKPPKDSKTYEDLIFESIRFIHLIDILDKFQELKFYTKAEKVQLILDSLPKKLKEKNIVGKVKLSKVICFDIVRSSSIENEALQKCILTLDESIENAFEEEGFSQVESVNEAIAGKYYVQSTGDGRMLFTGGLNVEKLLKITENILNKYNQKWGGETTVKRQGDDSPFFRHWGNRKNDTGKLRVGLSQGEVWYVKKGDNKIETFGGPAIVGAERVQSFGKPSTILLDNKFDIQGSLPELDSPVKFKDKNGNTFEVRQYIYNAEPKIRKLMRWRAWTLRTAAVILLFVASCLIYDWYWKKPQILVGSGTFYLFLKENIKRILTKNTNTCLYTESGIGIKILTKTDPEELEPNSDILAMTAAYYEKDSFITNAKNDYLNYFGIQITEDPLEVILGTKNEKDNIDSILSRFGVDPDSSIRIESLLTLVKSDSIEGLPNPFILLTTNEESGTKKTYREKFEEMNGGNPIPRLNKAKTFDIENADFPRQTLFKLPDTSLFIILGSKIYNFRDSDFNSEYLKIEKNMYKRKKILLPDKSIFSKPLVVYGRFEKLAQSNKYGCIGYSTCKLLEEMIEEGVPKDSAYVERLLGEYLPLDSLLKAKLHTGKYLLRRFSDSPCEYCYIEMPKTDGDMAKVGFPKSQ